MEKEDLLTNAKYIEFHEYHAPVYNINVGYVDKQINGDYYEYHTKNEEEKNSECEPHKKTGPKNKYLFIKNGKDTEENVLIKRNECERFCKYLTEHRLKSRRLTSSKDDLINSVVVCFWNKWRDMNFVAEKPSGYAIFRFLNEDCEMSTDVEGKSYANMIVRMINNKVFDIDTYKKVSEYFR